MVCLYCQSETRVTNSRPQKRTNSVWRRRHCQSCGALFSTTESVDLSQSIKYKALHDLEPFSRDVLFISVYESLRHRKTALDDATALVDTIITELLRQQSGSISREHVIVGCRAVLKRFDSVAFTHYTAYHPL